MNKNEVICPTDCLAGWAPGLLSSLLPPLISDSYHGFPPLCESRVCSYEIFCKLECHRFSLLANKKRKKKKLLLIYMEKFLGVLRPPKLPTESYQIINKTQNNINMCKSSAILPTWGTHCLYNSSLQKNTECYFHFLPVKVKILLGFLSVSENFY